MLFLTNQYVSHDFDIFVAIIRDTLRKIASGVSRGSEVRTCTIASSAQAYERVGERAIILLIRNNT